MPKRSLAAVLLGVLLLAQPAAAWDAFGHEVIARIAWAHMSPQARRATLALLRQAPDDSDLLGLALPGGSPAAAGRDLFELAATWPDVVRDRTNVARFEKYSHATWHYIDHYFRQTPQGAVDLTEPAPDSVNAVTELERMTAQLGDPAVPAARRALDLAWILHLVGDIHQPLHAASRVTAALPAGDRGGNLFLLADHHNLHSYWDSVISRAYPERRGESRADRVELAARAIMRREPERRLAGKLEPGRFADWALESYAVAKTIYDTPEGQEPGVGYRRSAEITADRQAALAGYRLAELLDRELGGAGR